jgi:hypothetical protein
MVWLYRSPIPVKRRGVIYLLTCLRGAEKKGGTGESAPCGGGAAQILPPMTERTLERGVSQ